VGCGVRVMMQGAGGGGYDVGYDMGYDVGYDVGCRFKVMDYGFRVMGRGFRVCGVGVWIQDIRYRV